MDNDKKPTSGAPSSDTTSALFVSARKKQLEQQEAERRAKEKEDQRLAAEAEVRRLEAEVEERRRKAEEEARRVEEEAKLNAVKAEEDARRIAEEARAKKVQAAENPDAVLGAPPQKKEFKLPQMPTLSRKTSNEESGVADSSTAKPPDNKKKMLLIGGAVLGIIMLVVIFGLSGRDDTTGRGDIIDSPASTKRSEKRGDPGDTTPQTKNAAWKLNTNATMDSSAVIDKLKMSISYPSSQLRDKSKDGAVMLTSMDDNAAIDIRALREYTGTLKKEDIIAMKNDLIASLNKNTPGGVKVTEDKYDAGKSQFKLTYADKDGKSQHICTIIGAWSNERNKAKFFFAFTLICPTEKANEYMPLFTRVFDSRVDI